MTFGVCGAPDCATAAQKAGFDYFEWSVQAFLQPRAEEARFREALEAVRSAPLPCPVCNCFLPGDLKVVGPAVDTAALEAYAVTACERAAIAGVDTIVFGSGGARAIPEGFDRSRAEAQILAFLELLAPVASRSGVCIVIEPLRFQECNILNTVAESARMTRAAGADSIRLLVDGYHWACNGESEADILAAAPLFRHMHVATQANRRTPGAEPCAALPRFLGAVRASGYAGRMSIEGRIEQPADELPVALGLMREASQA